MCGTLKPNPLASLLSSAIVWSSLGGTAKALLLTIFTNINHMAVLSEYSLNVEAPVWVLASLISFNFI